MGVIRRVVRGVVLSRVVRGVVRRVVRGVQWVVRLPVISLSREVRKTVEGRLLTENNTIPR